MNKTTIRLHPADNVAIAVDRTPSGIMLDDGMRVCEEIPAGHKFALISIHAGEPVRKFGQLIGLATVDIAAGTHVHDHNLAVSSLRDAVHPMPPGWTLTQPPKFFEGYRRLNGRIGVRNYVGIIASVNCAATVVRQIAATAERSNLLAKFPNVDGVVPLTHPTGCGLAGSGEGFEVLHRTLLGTATNPNFAAILLVGLGCEVLQIGRFHDNSASTESATFQSFNIQDVGGTRAAIAQGLDRLRLLLAEANKYTRESVPASELVLGLQCGGSDAWSGITSNPALGNTSDRLVALGATVILSETPEIYGAEHLLYARARTEQVSAKLKKRLEWWKDYTERNGGKIDNNPSPGNRAGGLSTILEKSLGAVAKAGTSPLNDVVEYAAPLTSRGLVFMDSPGFDPCSATGQVASGATLIAFTTGRGSAYGCKPSPSVKLSSNSDLFARMPEDIDLDCGLIASGTVDIEEKGAEILDYLLQVASGRQSKSEELGYGGQEFVPWQIGAVM